MAVLLDVSIPSSQPAVSNTPAIASVPSLLSAAQLSLECLVSIVQVVRASITAEPTPLIVNQQCMRCYADYVSYTAWHFFQCVGEHKNLTINKHFHEAHSRSNIFKGSDCGLFLFILSPDRISYYWPFVFGPVFSPIRAKIVTQIMSRKFWVWGNFFYQHVHRAWTAAVVWWVPSVDIVSQEVQVSHWGHCRVDDAFSTFMLVLSIYFLHPWKDLSQYQLLILSPHCQFSSQV